MGNIMGVDPSTTHTGYGIINEKGELVAWGVIHPKEDWAEAQKIGYQYHELKVLLEQYEVCHIACEDQFSAKNPDTFKKLCRTSAAVMMLSYEYQTTLELYYPSEWRKVCHGTGKVTKAITRKWVNQQFGANFQAKDHDITDAIGIGYAEYLRLKEIKEKGA